MLKALCDRVKQRWTEFSEHTLNIKWNSHADYQTYWGHNVI